MNNEQHSQTVYTCPMHPNIRQAGPGKCPQCGMDLTPTIGAQGQGSSMANMLKMCMNPKVLIGLGVVAVAVFIFNPSLAFRVLPLLLLAACPLSMVFMMMSMGNMHDSGKTNQLDILKQRLSKGEITEQEFDRLKTKVDA